jgi:hypothetical protein
MSRTLNANLSVSDPSYGVAAKGIVSPTPKLLTSGTFYRFAGSARPETDQPISRDVQIGSGWWMDEATYLQLITYLGADPNNWSMLARSALAVLYDWSTMDLLIAAQLTSPINVFAGVGAAQSGATRGGGTIRMEAPPTIKQIYIPNVRGSYPSVYVDGAVGLTVTNMGGVSRGTHDVVEQELRRIMRKTNRTVYIPDATILH